MLVYINFIINIDGFKKICFILIPFDVVFCFFLNIHF